MGAIFLTKITIVYFYFLGYFVKLSHCFLMSLIVVSSVHVSHLDAMDAPSPLNPRELFPDGRENGHKSGRRYDKPFILAQRDLTHGIMTIYGKGIVFDINAYVKVFGINVLKQPHYYGQEEPVLITMLGVAQKANNQAAIAALAKKGIR